MIGGKNSYRIYFNDGNVHLYNEEGFLIQELEDIGWYVEVLTEPESGPWGPFNDQREAIESLLIEWIRFESGYFIEDNKA